MAIVLDARSRLPLGRVRGMDARAEYGCADLPRWVWGLIFCRRETLNPTLGRNRSPKPDPDHAHLIEGDIL